MRDIPGQARVITCPLPISLAEVSTTPALEGDKHELHSRLGNLSLPVVHASYIFPAAPTLRQRTRTGPPLGETPTGIPEHGRDVPYAGRKDVAHQSRVKVFGSGSDLTH